MFLCAVAVPVMTHAEFNCCLKNLENGSVSCMLDRAVPETWSSSWTANINDTQVRSALFSENICVHLATQPGEVICILRLSYLSYNHDSY